MSINEVLTLREQLAAAEEQIKQYKDTIISQANELATLKLRNNLCTQCKSNLTASVAVGSSVRRRRSNSPSESEFATRKVRRRQNSPTVGSVLKSSQTHSSAAAFLLPPIPSESTLNLPSLPTATPISVQTIQSAPCQPYLPLCASHITSKPPPPFQALAASFSNPAQPKPESKFFVLPVAPDANRALPNVTFVDTFRHKNTVQSVRFSPNGKYLAVGLAGGIYGDKQGKVIIYNLDTKLKACVLVEHPDGEKSGIRSMSFSPGGEYLAVGYYLTHINVWSVPKKRVRNMFRGHGRPTSSVDFSPNGRLLVSASTDRTIRIWNMRDGSSRVLADSALSYRSVKFSPNGQYVAAGNEDHLFRVWNIRTGHLVLRWTGHQKAVNCVTFTPDGKGLLSGGYDKKVKYWDTSSLITAPPRRLPTAADVEAVNEEVLVFVGHKEAVTSVVCSPDSKWILTGSVDYSVRVWDAGDASLKFKLEGHQGLIWSVDVSPSGDYLAAGGWEGEVSLWRCIK